MHRLLIPLALLGALTLAGCESVRGWVPPLVQPYRPDVQQGNIITKEMVDQLRPGMTRDQVRFLLGTPILKNLFHEARWDYVYYLKRGKGDEQQLRRLTLQFGKDGKLDTFNSDDMPPETMADNLILGRNPKFQPKPPQKEDRSPSFTPTLDLP